ncbi:NAD-dependent epimerase/dehydratase family protein [Pseudobacteriovorax antillogorgiicola]|uniref:NAD-dependent epimerase/dehydratase domain-containing protein n=1 Tax=Pseudobacteriovorax antillogorgiicola TaxID=1513793 RepID=A0A1Y6CTD3_9BACT|nr:NAD-dependent epimerase/dehydratase family protein [Pseudobacteriovorax antillogorgiicola]TCS44580.1 dihydroflavonol-4-reductase/hypothetical protein [Pseudobacteriovorax antillogorgiicola]SMF78019.1 dihydroflavonol-4-reductase/hypothetical protein [Pseudobacteriovorax antillogorgiicola]
MRAFVTGGTGFIGLHVVKELIADRWDVTVLYRKTSDLSRLDNLDVQLVEGDIVDQDQMARILSQGFDAVFHVAGDVSLWRMKNDLQNQINIHGTRTLARQSLKHEVGRFVHTSSVAVWGLPDGTINERSEKKGPTAPINYMKSKFYGEQEVLACVQEGLDAVILNPCHVMGPYDEQNWSQLFTMIHRGQLPGVPPGLGTFCHVKDVAKAHLQALYKGTQGECYLLGGSQASYLDVGREVAELLQVPAPKQLPAWLLAMSGQYAELVSWFTGREPAMTPEKAALLSHDVKVDCTKAINHLDYEITPVSRILEESFHWLKHAGYLS